MKRTVVLVLAFLMLVVVVPLFAGGDPENGAVFIDNGGTFIMHNGTVSGNIGYDRGVVVHNGTFTMENGTILGNTSGGVSTSDNGTFIMEGGTISNNTGRGVSNGGTFTMKGGVISGNAGGGVYNSGIFTMQDNASVSKNTTNNNGSGVYVDGGTFSMQNNASVTSNTVSSDDPDGGGIYVKSGTFTIQDSASVSGNTAGWGGGVFVKDGTFTMKGGSVSSNTATFSGGGVYNSRTFIMQDSASMSGNTAYWGGAVYIDDNGTFTKTGGTISGDDAEQNLKNTAISGKGFAVYENKNKGWRNASAGPTANTGSYGFWLNEEAVATGFPPSFIGVWKRSRFNNTLAFTTTMAKSSSRDVTWKFISASGDTYTFEANTAAKTRLTLTVKYIDGGYWPGHLEISGDSGSGENNWNGDWYKQ